MKLSFFAFVSAVSGATELSLPHLDPNEAQRQSEVAEVASQIQNEPRAHFIDGVPIPLNPGPIPRPGSLAQLLAGQDAQLLISNSNPNQAQIFHVANQTEFTSFEDYDTFYQELEHLNLAPFPQNKVDVSDANFAKMRLGLLGNSLKRVDDLIDLGLTEDQVIELCDRSLYNLVHKQKLYVEDLAFVSQYNNPDAPHKHVPGAKGYYCVRKDKSFMPLAIHLVDTGLIYSPFDSESEWTLAKMAMNTACLNEQQMDHFVQTHLFVEPIKVEMLRTMSTRHPIYKLLDHHLLQVFGNTLAGLQNLFTPGTALDYYSGWGAVGAMKFTSDRLNGLNFNDDYEAKLKANNIDKIPNYQKRDDVRDIYKVLRKFVKRYLKPYYSGSDISQDYELQNWLGATSVHIIGFPASADKLNDVVNILVNIIFRTAVQHHMLNSDVTWHIVSFPYSLPGLFAPLPTTKGGAIQLQNYVIPTALLPLTVAAISGFDRPFEASISILHSYGVADLGTQAENAIEKYQADMNALEGKITTREEGNSRPYKFLKPSHLPHYVWV